MKDSIKTWLRAAGIRAIKTFAQTATAALGVGATVGAADIGTALVTSVIAAVLSLLTSCAGLPEIGSKEEK